MLNGLLRTLDRIRAGHAMTIRLLRALFADTSAYRFVEVGGNAERKLPGMGVHRGDLPVHA